MLIKERKYRVCKSCDSRHLVSNEVYSCDTCRKIIDTNKPEREYLAATIFTHKDGNRDIQCCSWACMVTALRKVKTDYFVSLPFLHFDPETAKGMRAKDFFALFGKQRPGDAPPR